ALGRAGERAFLAHRDDGADLSKRNIGHPASLSEKLMLKRRIYYFGKEGHPARIFANSRRRGQAARLQAGGTTWARRISASADWIGSSASTGTGCASTAPSARAR